MKPLRLILPITLFILSGVLACITSFTFEGSFLEVWVIIVSIALLVISGGSLVWALGGFDD